MQGTFEVESLSRLNYTYYIKGIMLEMTCNAGVMATLNISNKDNGPSTHASHYINPREPWFSCG